MSIFSNQTWSGACLSANQSPVNLSQSSAKPCNMSCSFSFDDMTPPQGSVQISDEGLILQGQLGSCKFREQTYSCNAVIMNHPSHHTLEGVAADGEVVALFQTPTGEYLMVSSLFRVNPNETPSFSFFKQFVPYAQTAGPSQVSLNSWSLTQLGSGDYYTYSGSSVVPPCVPCEWVVFKTMVNIDPTDFAFLVRNVQAGSRNIQSLGTRDIFYNDQAAGGPMPNDNKTYMRCRPTGKKSSKPLPVKSVDLKTDMNKNLEEQSKNDKTTLTSATKQYVAENGWLSLLEVIVTFLAVAGGVYTAYKYGYDKPFAGYTFVENAARWLRGYKNSPISVP